MSGRSIKAFLDANTLISGLLFKGNEATLLELGRIKAIQLVTNNYVMDEVRHVLQRPEFNLNQNEINELWRYLNTCLTIQAVPSLPEIQNNFDLLDDKKDIPVALGFQNSDATYLVTGDKELFRKIQNTITTKRILEKILE